MATIARDIPPSTAAFEIAPPEFEFPFLQNGDAQTFLVTRYYKQLLTGYLADRPTFLRDKAYVDCFLIRESVGSRTASGMVTFSRTFSMVPKQQTVPSSMFVSRPEIPGTFPQTLGTSLIIQPDSTVASYDAYASRTVTGDSGAPTSTPTGGTYTLSFAGSTTASINHSDTNTTVATRLNALTPVSNRGNVTVTGAYNTGGFAVAFTSYAAATASIGSLTTTGTLVARIVTANAGYTQTVNIEQSASSPPMSVNASALSTSFTGFGSGSGASATIQVNYAGTGKTLVTIAPTYGGAIDGGTYTVTINGATTTALAYNASSSTVQTAITVLGSYTVSSFAISTSTGTISFYVSGTTGTITAGSFTLTMFTQTTASIAYNANAAAIQSALNLLSSVSNRGNCVVTGTGLASDALSISFTITFTNAAITGTSSLTPTGASVSSAITDAVGQLQTITLGLNSATRDLSVTGGHGITAGDTIFISDGTTYYTGITNFSVPSTTTIRLIVTATDTWATLSSVTLVGKRTLAGYTPGISLTRCNRVTDYYLPGVSDGITTANDIPLPVFQGDPASLLLAIFNGASSINYQVGELDRWRDSQILARTITTINAQLL
jgi:hypothetical protein